MIKLRPYQQEALEKIRWCIKEELPGGSIISLPTGAGKSIVIAEMANYLNQNILIFQPTKEILEQNVKKLMQYVPEEEIGIYSASKGRKDIRKYTFAMIGSVYKKAEEFKDFKIVIIDECHLVNMKKESGMYMSFLEALNIKQMYGFTATSYRQFPTYFTEYTKYGSTLYMATSIKLLNRVHISKVRKEYFWHRILFNIDCVDLIEQGYLSPLEYIDKTSIKQEFLPLNKSQTDFDIEKYDVVAGKHDKEISEIIDVARNKYKSVLVFCNSIAQSKRLNIYFPTSERVDSETKPKDRERVIENFRSGKTKIVFNVGVLTTGFDMPELDCIVLLRPTKSIALYYQMLGRGVRIAPGKEKCTVIDWTDTVNKIGPIESIKLTRVKGMWNVVSSAKPEGWNGVQLYKLNMQKEEKSSVKLGLFD